MSKVWEISLRCFELANDRFPVVVHSFVLMNNHYHLILSTPDANLDKFMYEFNKNFSLLLRLETKLVNRMFGGRYKWCLITNSSYLQHAHRYVYNNPVRARIVSLAQLYEFSTLGFILKNKSFVVPIEVNHPWYDESEEFLSWVNAQGTEFEIESVGRALRKHKFELRKRSGDNKPLELTNFSDCSIDA